MSYDSWKLSNGETAADLARFRASEAAEHRVAAALGDELDEVNTEGFDDGSPVLSVRLRCLSVVGDGDECETLARRFEAMARALRGGSRPGRSISLAEYDAVAALAALRNIVKKADEALATGEWPGRAGCAAFRADTAAIVRRIEAALGNL